jgi:SNF2 family DNA or RNA helicase
MARAQAKFEVRQAANFDDAPTVDVVVTTYTYFERESSGDDRKFFRSIDWDYMVILG